MKIYFEVGDADSLGLYRGGEFLHRLLLDKGVKHEYRLVHGADHNDTSIPARLSDAMQFLGRVLEDTTKRGKIALDSIHDVQ
jgi:S-formylglutathione hydrolase